MLIIRPAQEKDLKGVLALAHKAGTGMTSLPTSAVSLGKKLRHSVRCFSRTHGHEDDAFLLVMEDTENDRIVGTAGVVAHTGSQQAYYAYRIMPVTHYSHSLDKQVKSELLHLSNDYTGHSVVGTLFLDPDYRGNGRWLSASRYMLMAEFPNRFAKHAIAELRGKIDEEGNCPFWDAIGQHFFSLSFAEADTLCATGSNQFITELMPRHPIYTNLLNEAGRHAIGATHPSSEPARKLLEKEGYEYDRVIDIFDGGPIYKAKVSEIHSVKTSELFQVKCVANKPTDAQPILVTNRSLDQFRAAFLPATLVGQSLHIYQYDADQLQVKEGEWVRCLPTSKQNNKEPK